MSDTAGSQIPGAHRDSDGVNFALYAGDASAVELCLFDANGNETQRTELSHCHDGLFHGYLPGCEPGQRYGYRVHGELDPAAGKYRNPNKLLVDPYARQLSGSVTWAEALFSKETDSAPFVPKCVVRGERDQPLTMRPATPWADTIIYELNVRGFTMLHPAIPDSDRGRFAGLSNSQVLEYLRALGITAVELLPVHAIVDEEFLGKLGLSNYWGYNTLNYFAPDNRFAVHDGAGEFRSMVNAIHDAGIEVIMDVVYNHTAEGGSAGPTLSYRGIDNLAYYRTLPDAPGEYVNDTGCGNTLNVDHPRVQDLVLDSLRYWATEMGVDGFRFDLCTVLGRTMSGFDAQHPLLRRIEQDPELEDTKLIAEPWDIGPGGYQLGQFSNRWSEWNDKYRDSVRRFWRGDAGETAQFARRLHGSADVFEVAGRSPRASINLVTSHDGFTLADLVSFESRHNEANGEMNRDGHSHNFSSNHGVEGPTDDDLINQLRRRQRLNMLATLLLSQGTPMILAGDEIGNSQHGNNNAYAQDNATSWINWQQLESDPGFAELVRQLLWLRRNTPLIKGTGYRHAHETNASGRADIEWLTPAGISLTEVQWQEDHALMLLLTEIDQQAAKTTGHSAVAFVINATEQDCEFSRPAIEDDGEWSCEFTSAAIESRSTDTWQLPDRSCACFVFRIY